MNLRHIQQQIGAKLATAARLARRLELTDRLAECHGHPQQGQAIRDARRIRHGLSQLYTEIHGLEAMLPTPELLSERAFNRALALGLEIEAAEAARVTAYRDAQRHSQLRAA